MSDLHGDTPDFLSKDWRFRDLRGMMACTYSNLRMQGVWAKVKHMPIMKEEEDQLWSANEMGTDTPKKLLQSFST